MDLSAQGAVIKLRADGMDYYVVNSNNGYQGDFESALIPDSFKKDILGYIEDKNGVLVEDAGAVTQPFALLFQFEGDANATRHVLYYCKATRPQVASQTTEETIEPVTETISVTATARNVTIDNNVIPLVKAKCAPTDSAYANFFTAVQVPGA